MKKLTISVLTAIFLIAVMVTPAIAYEDTQTATAEVTVGEVVSITITGGINFGSVAVGSTEVDGELTQTDGNPAITITIASETNVEVHVGIKGAIQSGTLALDNWFYSTLFDKSDIDYLTGSYVEVYAGKQANDTCAFYHWITVPSGTSAGDHSVLVSYKAAKTGVAFE